MNLDDLLREHLSPELANLKNPQTDIPKIAKNPQAIQSIQSAISHLSTTHTLYLRDAREMDIIDNESTHLVVTSPPYWNLKEYPSRRGQLGSITDYELFLESLLPIWKHCFRILVKGGRLVIVVGDVCLSRRKHGRHMVVPLHASIQEQCRGLGFDNLAPIIWYKITNAQYEVENGSRFLGKPYEPNAIIKNDIEYILMQRKPGGYRRPSVAARLLSVISEENHREWFQQIWTIPGESTRNHPAPFPLDLAGRLVRMFSFAGDTVVDPFMGTGTTNLAAAKWGRNSIGFEIHPSYLDHAHKRLSSKTSGLFSSAALRVVSST
ncbi:MAG: site-specific DNA-methyltransferase [Nitrospinae bacterium]|nr:site-specific DNA-methyltransferase [Nitrospinota bacterium]